jgi:pre-mRNA-splicing factor SYF1
LDNVPISHLIVIYERALALLPGSYKLWKLYLDWNKVQLRKLTGWEREDEIQRVNGTYRRALLTLHKMPRLWTEYLIHLTTNASHQISLIWRSFDAALQSLPTTQHSRIWELYLPWAESVGGPLAVSVHKRYLKVFLKYFVS